MTWLGAFNFRSPTELQWLNYLKYSESYRESFDSDWNLGASSQIILQIERFVMHAPKSNDDGLWIFIQIGTSERGAQIIWFRLELRSGFVNLLIRIRTSEHVLQIIYYGLELRSGFANQFPNWKICDTRSDIPIWKDRMVFK